MICFQNIILKNLKTLNFFSFNVATCDENKGDIKFLYDRLIHINRKEVFEYYRLAEHLLERLEDFHYVEVEKLDDLMPLLDIISLKIIKSISRELKTYRQVYKSKW